MSFLCLVGNHVPQHHARAVYKVGNIHRWARKLGRVQLGWCSTPTPSGRIPTVEGIVSEVRKNVHNQGMQYRTDCKHDE